MVNGMKNFFLLALLGLLISCNMPKYTSKKENGNIVFSINNRPIVSYRYNLTYPPKGVDTAYKRSGYIHPIKTLGGHTVTQIQPSDHYHHYGLWNPWTHVLYKKDTLDFWNLKKGLGTVRFKNIVSLSTNSYKVHQEHVVLKNGIEEVALNETQEVQIHYISDKVYSLHLTIRYECATENPFKILEYRYGGLCLRGTKEWDTQTSLISSDRKKERDSLDGSLAKWCKVEGKLGDSYGGVAILSHPQNYNHPQPLRVWPEETEGDGNVFINFAPTKNKDWVLKPGKTYTLRYKLIIFDGILTDTETNVLYDIYRQEYPTGIPVL